MAAPFLTELPYHEDSACLFEAIADSPWAVFLDSGRHYPAQSRYDILSAQPYLRLVTRGALTEIYGDGVELSREDPFSLLKRALVVDAACGGELPFSGGAIGYFGYNGNLDTCIVIRTIMMKGKKIFISAGAGIVADSDPALEYQETLNKARGMLRAVELAESWRKR